MERVKSRKKNWISIILLVVILGAIMAVWFWYWQKQATESDEWLEAGLPEIKSTRTQNLKKTKNDVLSVLETAMRTGKYGAWPVEEVSLSAGRGNPFKARSVSVDSGTNTIKPKK